MLAYDSRIAKETTGDSAAPILLLEIARGDTRHPVRPVTTDRFLIGASAACDLRLGGESVPPLHSLIVREPDGGFRWEKVSGTATLFCNGRLVDTHQLREGDRVRIGPVEFLVRLRAVVANPSNSDSSVVSDDMPVDDLSAMSASDLADRFESEWEMVDRFESRRQLGIESLLSAVAERVGEDSETENHAAHDLRNQLRQLAQQIDNFAGARDDSSVDDDEVTGTMAMVREAERRLNLMMQPETAEAA